MGLSFSQLVKPANDARVHDPLALFIQPEVHGATAEPLGPDMHHLRLAPETKHLWIRLPVGNLQIELPCEGQHADDGASRLLAADAHLIPYENPVQRAHMAKHGKTLLERTCEAVQLTLLFADVSLSGEETVRRQSFKLGAALFGEGTPAYGLEIGPVGIKLMLFEGEQSHAVSARALQNRAA
jgi:hypothetical protein